MSCFYISTITLPVRQVWILAGKVWKYAVKIEHAWLWLLTIYILKNIFWKCFSSFEACNSICIYVNNFTFCFLLDPINYNQDQFPDQTVSIMHRLKLQLSGDLIYVKQWERWYVILIYHTEKWSDTLIKLSFPNIFSQIHWLKYNY